MTDVRDSGPASSQGHESPHRGAPDAPGGQNPGGLVRDRLTVRLIDPSSYRVGWVVAPAGSGKSRLLAHVAARFDGPVVVCEPPDPVPRTHNAFVAWLAERIAAVGDSPDQTEAASIRSKSAPIELEDLLSAPTTADGAPILVVIDDAHLLEGSDAESALDALIARLPASWRLLVATRMNLAVDLSRLRVSGQVVDIGPDELRFRTWEVEDLFRHIYREPMLPEEVAALTRRTAGWAAYLQLFYLATNRRPAAERRLMLGSLRHRTRLVSEYLGRHVLAGLAPELRDFLVRTSVLRRSTPRLCDEFLGWESGSEALLTELERRQLFTERLADETYRYHAVLLSYLDSELVDKMGLDGARDEHRRAATLLEREGWTEEAMTAYARSGDWEAVSRLIGQVAPTSDSLDEDWGEALPAAVLEADPLLLMVRARSELGHGSLVDAALTLRRAEEVAASAAVAERCRLLRDQILAWVEPDRLPQPDWVGTIRSAFHGQPGSARRHARSLPGVGGRFAEGCAALVEGDAIAAGRLLRAVRDHPEAPAAVSGAAGLLNLGASVLTGRDLPADGLAKILEEVERSGPRWLARIARAGLPVPIGENGSPGSAGGDDTVEDLKAACEREGDHWGEAAISTIDALRRLDRGDPSAEAALEASADALRGLGAGALQAIALSWAALAAHRAGRSERAMMLAGRAAGLGVSLDVPTAVAVASLVTSTGTDSSPGTRTVLETYGTWPWYSALIGSAGEEPVTDADGTPAAAVPVRLRCLGDFELEIDGHRVDDAQAKPMERALLHLLCTGAGSAMHRETLVGALWPEADQEAGLHRLQVAVSALRRLLGRAGPVGADLVGRVGDSYRLALPAGSIFDLADFDAAADRAAAARAAGDQDGEQAALETAFSLYAGELLPADGPADWVLEPRRRAVAAFTEVAARLASLLLESDPPRACRVARVGIGADRYQDQFWKVLIEGAERSGHHAEAEAARRDYETMLDDLGV